MWYERAYNYGRGLVIVLYILVVLGIGQHSPQYLETVDNALRIFIGIVLVALFNPWTHTSFNQFHRKIVFTFWTDVVIVFIIGILCPVYRPHAA